MATTATVISDVALSDGRRRVTYEYDTGTGLTWRKSPKIAAGANAQADAEARITTEERKARQTERETAIARCIAGEDPATIDLHLVVRPKLWEAMTRRLHNGPRRGLDVETMRGLAQHVINRSNPAIRADLNNVRSNAEVLALKTEWQLLLDTGVTEYDEIEEQE